jgi:transaldolase
MDKPVDPHIVSELLSKFVEFRKAYNDDGLSMTEFDSYGPTARTLRQFLAATHELASCVRDIILPSPDALG